MKKLLLTSLVLIAGMNVTMTQVHIPVPQQNQLGSLPPIVRTYCQGITVTLTPGMYASSLTWQQQNSDGHWLEAPGLIGSHSFTPILRVGNNVFRWRASSLIQLEATSGFGPELPIGAWIESVEVHITVDPLPTISAIATPAALCVGQQLTRPTPTVTNGTSQGWQIETGVGTGQFSNITLPRTVSIAYNGRRIRYRATNDCGAGYSNTVTITVNNPPTITGIISAPVALCVGEQLTLNEPTVGHATSQGWEIETGVGTGQFSNITLPRTVSSADHGRRIHYRAHNNNCGERFSNVVTITVSDVPSISDISAPVAHCVGSSLTLPDIPTVNSAIIFTQGWEIETGFGTSDYIDFVPPHVVSFADHGRRIRYRASNRCGTPQFSNTVMIPVDAGPSAFTPLNDERICGDNPVTVNFGGVNIDASQSTWTNSNPSIGLAANGTGNLDFTAINSTESPVTSTITVTPVSSSGCSNLELTQEFSIRVYPSFNAGAIGTIGQAVAFNGLAETIGSVDSAWGGDGNIEYRWKRNGVVVAGATNATHVPRTNVGGTFVYTREVRDGTCSNDWTLSSGEWELTVVQISIDGADRICIGATTDLSSSITGTWVSEAPNVARVDANSGRVTGLSQGATAFTFIAADVKFQTTTALVFVSGDMMLPEVNDIVAKTDLSGIPYMLVFPNPAGNYAFQWYHNDTLIEGATSQFLHPANGLQEGEYRVYVHHRDLRVSCGRLSEPFQVSLPLMSTSAEWFFLYPNPSDGRFSVVFNKDVICDKTTVTIGLFSLQGARIMERQVIGSENVEFNENLNSGIYVLRITTDNNLSGTKQIVVRD